MNCDNLTRQDIEVLKTQLKKTEIGNYPVALYAIFWIIITKIVLIEEEFRQFATYCIMFAPKNMELFNQITKYSIQQKISFAEICEKYIDDPKIKRFLVYIPDFKNNLTKYLELIGYSNLEYQLKKSILCDYTVENFRLFYDYVISCACTRGTDVEDIYESDRSEFNVFLKTCFADTNVNNFIQKTRELANRRANRTRYNIFVRICEFLYYDNYDMSEDEDEKELETNEKILVDMLIQIGADVSTIKWTNLLIDGLFYSKDILEYTFVYNVDMTSSFFLYLIKKDRNCFFLHKRCSSIIERKFGSDTINKLIKIENKKLRMVQ